MGGSFGGGIPHSDLKRLEETAKQTLRELSSGTSPHVFISFNYDDIDEVNLLRAQVKNERTDLQFDDFSVKEAFESDIADYIKRKIRELIDRCSVTIVYLSERSASSEWVNWEIEQSLKRGKDVIGVFKGEQAPANLPLAFHQNGCKAVKWNHTALMQAIEQNRKKG